MYAQESRSKWSSQLTPGFLCHGLIQIQIQIQIHDRCFSLSVGPDVDLLSRVSAGFVLLWRAHTCGTSRNFNHRRAGKHLICVAHLVPTKDKRKRVRMYRSL